ncbi:MAG: chemotaxis protein CheW [Prochloraceae cyanobacterium]
MGADFLSIPETSSSATDSGNLAEQFLRFHLVPDTNVILPISQLTEVMTIPLGQIIPIPHMPAWVMGVYNWRGEILWMVDIGQLVGLTPWYQQNLNSANYKAIVVKSSGEKSSSSKIANKVLGLVVSQVEDIEWCNPETIQSPPSSGVTPKLASFLRGYWLKPNGEIIVVLDGEAIIAAMPAQTINDN